MSIAIKDGQLVKGYNPDSWNVYLIQRLNKRPDYKGFEGKANWNPFSNDRFLSEEARKIMHEICEFDYMGSAEFEWGAIPAALQWFALESQKGSLVTGIVQVAAYSLQQKVYYISATGGDQADTRLLIKLLSDLGAEENEHELKERCNLRKYLVYHGAKESLTPEELSREQRNWNVPRFEPQAVGWIVLGDDKGAENHGLCMFFVDEIMFQSMCNLFGVKK